AKKARAEGEAANGAKDESRATLSPELPPPLNAILGWTEILCQDGAGGANRSRALEALERSARLQLQLVEDVLDVSRIVAGKLQLEPQAVDLAGVVRSALHGVQPAAHP